MVVRYILKVSLCENRQKQQKETLSYFELETLNIDSFSAELQTLYGTQ